MGRKKVAQFRVVAQKRGGLAPEVTLPADAVLATLFTRQEGLRSRCVSGLEPWRVQITA